MHSFPRSPLTTPELSIRQFSVSLWACKSNELRQENLTATSTNWGGNLFATLDQAPGWGLGCAVGTLGVVLVGGTHLHILRPRATKTMPP